jgi:hypothetical protein
LKTPDQGLVQKHLFASKQHFVKSAYNIEREMVQMNCTKRTKGKILGYSALFKKLGIINEQEYKNITDAYRIKG